MVCCPWYRRTVQQLKQEKIVTQWALDTVKGEILPGWLLRELQQYVDGSLLYLPQAGKKLAWGARSGAREYCTRRNREIRGAWQSGAGGDCLVEKYGLSEDAVRKILL